MEGLIVVHPIEGYADPYQMGVDEATRISGVFEKISREIDSYLSRGDFVYTLQSGHDDSPLHSCVRRFENQEGFVYVPGDVSYEAQFLLTKEQVVLDKVRSLAVCGFARDVCVKDVYDLFRGVVPDKDRALWKKRSDSTRWSDEKFDKIFRLPLEIRVIEELC